MSSDWTRSVARVWGEQADDVRGAGFVVGDGLVVTCAHVLPGSPGKTRVWVDFPQLPECPGSWAEPLSECYRAPDEEDVAILRMVQPPAEATALSLRSVVPSSRWAVDTFGYPEQAPPGGHRGRAVVVGAIDVDPSGRELFQLGDAGDITKGFSGAPLRDALGLVVGMVAAYAGPDPDLRGLDIAYATPGYMIAGMVPGLQAREECPYPGLQPFTAAEGRWFHGRRGLVSAIRTHLEATPGVSVLLGPSGSGKTSVAAAGLLPELAKQPVPAAGSNRLRATTLLRPSGQLPAVLAEIDRAGTEPVVVVIDQFEELLTLLAARPSALDAPQSCGRRAENSPVREPEDAGPGNVREMDQARSTVEDATVAGAILKRLINLATGSCVGRVLLLVQDTFYPQLAGTELLAAVGHGRLIDVPATLTRDQVTEVITEPARAQGWNVEPVLVEHLIQDVIDVRTEQVPATQLPMLALTLNRIWARATRHTGDTGRVSAVLNLEHYVQAGGLVAAITDHCDRALGDLGEADGGIARQVLTALVRAGDPARTVPATRRRLSMPELIERITVPDPVHAEGGITRVVNELATARVLVTARIPPLSGSASEEDDSGTVLVELAHEAIVEHWTTLHGWLEEDRGYRAWLDVVLPYARDWAGGGRDPRELLGPGELERAERHTTGRQVPELVAEYVETTRREKEKREEEEDRRVRRARLLIRSLSAIAVLALAAASLTGWQWWAVTHPSGPGPDHTAAANLLAARSRDAVDSDPNAAQLYALAALQRADTPAALTPGSPVLAAAEKAVARPLAVTAAVIRHASSVSAVAWSPDGTRLATASSDRTARVWDGHAGRAMVTLKGHGDWVGAAAWSPDGTRLATSSGDGTARVWDARTGRVVATLGGHRDWVGSIVWSPDGTRLATASGDRTARVWDASTGHSLLTLQGHARAISALAWSPDGTRLATASHDQTARVWDTGTGRAVATLQGHSESLYGLAWSPDGTRLATASGDGTGRIWDPDTGRLTAALAGHSDWVGEVVWSPDGTRLATSSGDRTARVWDASTGHPLGILEGHARALSTVVWSPDGARLATASADGTARIWDPGTGQGIAVLAGHAEGVSGLAWSPDGDRLATGSGDGTARVWDARTGHPLATLEGHTRGVTAVAWSPDGARLATASQDRNARIWDPGTGRTTAVLIGPTAGVSALAWSPDGARLATASGDGAVLVWDPGTGRTTAVLIGPTAALSALAWSPDGGRLATGSGDGTARVWDPGTGRTTAVLSGHTDAVSEVAWSPGGTELATASGDGTARIWNTDSGKASAILTGHRSTVTAIAWSPDGTRLATTSQDRTVRVRSLPSAWPRQLCERAGRNLTLKEWTAVLGHTPYRRQCAQWPAGPEAPANAPADPLPRLPQDG